MLIKAGTYRFNDVLTAPSGDLWIEYIEFTAEANLDGVKVVSHAAFSFGHDGDDFSLDYVSVNDDGTTTQTTVYESSESDYYVAGWRTSYLGVHSKELLMTLTGLTEEQASLLANSYGETIKTITIPTDTEVSAEFADWFTANAVEVVEDTPAATITHNGEVIAALNAGQTATLKCAGMKMAGDVVVSVAEQTSGGKCDCFEDVTELPETVDDSKIYRMQNEDVSVIVVVVEGELQVITREEVALSMVDELPESDDSGSLYIVRSTGIGYMYADAWYTFGQVLAMQAGMAIEDKGYITSAEITENLAVGIYVVKADITTLGIPNTNKVTKVYEFEKEWVRCDTGTVRGFLEETLDELTIPYGTEKIRDYACAWFRDLKRLTIPDTVKYIGKFAFGGINVRSLEIPASVDMIGEGAFSESELEQVVIHGSPSIYEGAFSYTNLTSVTIPNLIQYIDSTAFDNTPLFKNASNWENNVFYVGHCLMQGNAECAGDLVVKAGTKVIASYAFWKCNNLESVVLPHGVQRLNSRSFTVPDGKLKSVVFPETIEYIDQNLFSSDAGVAITVKATTPPELFSPFWNNQVRAIYVPAESVDAYKAAENWRDSASIIYPIEG